MDHPMTPPRLVRGSYPAGSGVGCIMNLMCWEQGLTTEINDNPAGFNRNLRVCLIRLNDCYCADIQDVLIDHPYGGKHYAHGLCTDCSMWLVDLAHAFLGTEDLGLTSRMLSLLDAIAKYTVMGGTHSSMVRDFAEELKELVLAWKAMHPVEMQRLPVEEAIQRMHKSHQPMPRVSIKVDPNAVHITLKSAATTAEQTSSAFEKAVAAFEKAKELVST